MHMRSSSPYNNNNNNLTSDEAHYKKKARVLRVLLYGTIKWANICMRCVVSVQSEESAVM